MTFLKAIIFSIATALTIWVAGYFAFAVSAMHIQPEAPDQKVDAIVVLTGGYGRIEEGLRLFAEGNAEHLFISGVHPDVSRSEIRNMWKGPAPLPNCCIMLGYDSRTTQQNAEETRDWLANKTHKSIRVVTGNFHIPRTLAEYRHVLPDTEIIPHGIVQPRFESDKLLFWQAAFYEYNKSLFRWVVFQLEDYLPDSIINLQLNKEFELS